MTRTVVVTGGGTGIGRATAVAFARRGDDVLIVGRRRDPLETAAAELGVRWAIADLADASAVEAAFADEPRAVDVLVNNAGGVASTGGEGLAAVAAEWEAALRGNVLTAVLPTAALLARLRRPGGRVVNVSSIAALRGGGTYGAAKATLIGWSYALAAELGPDGITVNVVAPGFIEGTEFFAGSMTPERRERLIGETLVGRPGRPEDVAEAIVYLASPEAAHVTGQILQVNGGALLGR
jgi:3-oxoacyl-[acyl-carrier protein] reductase